MQTELEKRLRNGGKETEWARAHKKEYTRKKTEVEQQAALRIKEKLKTRKVTTTKTRLHEPLFMPLMNANKLKWLKKETKTYALQKYTKDIVCHKRCSGRARERDGERENDQQQTVKSRKRKPEKSNRIKYLNKHSPRSSICTRNIPAAHRQTQSLIQRQRRRRRRRATRTKVMKEKCISMVFFFPSCLLSTQK